MRKEKFKRSKERKKMKKIINKFKHDNFFKIIFIKILNYFYNFLLY